ncbi:TolC family protein [Sulfurimonas sp. HSL-1656]|uniref:TolC family protein n=1 Tax=Thiomicrolovo subterrani TaxID=3131934 RepID=UPI0031F91519
MPMLFKKLFYLLLPISSLLYAMSMEETVALGLTHNQQLQSADLQISLADEQKRESASRHFGKIEAVANYSHYNTPRTLFPLTPAAIATGASKIATTQDLFSAGIHYQASLFSGYELQDTEAVAELQRKIASLKYRLAREELIFTIRSAYIDALGAQANAKAWEHYSEAMGTLYSATKRMVSLGKKAEVELLKVDAERLGSETNAELFAAQRESMVGLLTVLTGGTRPLIPLEDIPIVPSLQSLRDAASSSRIQINNLLIDQTEKNEHKSHASSLPQAGIEGYYGYSFGPNDPTNPYSGNWEHQELWNIGLNLQWNILDFGTSSAKQQQARILKIQQKHSKAHTVLQVEQDRREGTISFNTAKRRYELAKKEYALAQKTEEIETLRYQEGEISMNDFLLQKAKTQMILSEMISSRYALLKAYYILEYLYEQGDTQ